MLAVDDNIVLEVDDTSVRFPVERGIVAATALAEQLSPLTRSAPLTLVDTYTDAKRRLELASRGRRDTGALMLFLGDKDVFADENTIYIDDRPTCSLSELARLAENHGHLTSGSDVIQAGLVLLVVAANYRHEDVTLLARRVSEYEAAASKCRADSNRLS